MSCWSNSCYNPCFDGSQPWWQPCCCQTPCCQTPCCQTPCCCATWPNTLPIRRPCCPPSCCCPSYAFYYTTAAQTLSAVGQSVDFTAGSSTPDISLSNGDLLFSRAGVYKVLYTMTAAAPTVGTPAFQLELNSTPLAGTVSTVSAAGTYAGQAIVTVAAGQIISLTQTVAGTVSISFASITAQRIQ